MSKNSIIIKMKINIDLNKSYTWIIFANIQKRVKQSFNN